MAMLTDTVTLNLTEREVMVILHALHAYKNEIRNNSAKDDAGARLEIDEAQHVIIKIRNA